MYICTVASRSDSHLCKHFVKENIFFPAAGEISSNCIPHAEDSSCISTFPSLSQWSLCLCGTEPPGCSYQRELVGLSWESAGHGAMELCIMLHQHRFSESPSGEHRKGTSYCRSHEGRKRNPSELKAGIGLLGYQV